MNEDAPGVQLPASRHAILRRMMQAKGVREDQIEAEIARYLAELATITVPSDAELRAMQQRGEMPSDEELRRAIP
jgi:hypothetical protein